MKLSFKNIGPVKESEIELDNITIISGANDSGKSTIGKVLYAALVKPLNTLESEVFSLIQESIREMEGEAKREFISFLLDNKYSEDELFEKENNSSSFISIPMRIGLSQYSSSLKIVEKHINENPTKIIDNFINYFESNGGISDDIRYTLRYYMKLFESPNEFKNEVIKDTLKAEYDGEYKNIEELESEINIVGNEIEVSFNDTKELQYTNRKYTNVVYFEPKMDIMHEAGVVYGSRYQFGLDHNKYLRWGKNTKSRNVNIYSEEIQKLNKMFDSLEIKKIKNGKYQLENKEIKIKNVATGVKNFVGLRSLIDRGILSRSTLLIIDEPETALHPSWQVSYIEILQEIKKLFDLDIILVTHSNYIVEASEKLFEDDIKIYLSNRTEDGIVYQDCTSNSNVVYDALGVAYEKIDSLSK